MILAVPLAVLGLVVVTLSSIAAWRYYTVRQAARVPAEASAVARSAAAAPLGHPAEAMFGVPDGVFFHPGHTWARPQDSRVVTIGIDDFARQLVGPLVGILLPEPGTRVLQGVAAMTLRADAKQVDVLSPVTGRVRSVNRAAAGTPDVVNDDPYGHGWLLEIDASHFGADRRQLMSGAAAREWTSASWDELSSMLSPQLGTILHDGGTPIEGFARGIDPERWDEVARRFLRS
jgi:glycine cleavage system H protein